MSVAVYGNDPTWTTSELIAYPQGRAAVALECVLMIMMFGQVRAAGVRHVPLSTCAAQRAHCVRSMRMKIHATAPAEARRQGERLVEQEAADWWCSAPDVGMNPPCCHTGRRRGQADGHIQVGLLQQPLELL